MLEVREVINLIICIVTSPRICKPLFCDALLRTLANVLVNCGAKLCGLLFKLIRNFTWNRSSVSSQFGIRKARHCTLWWSEGD